MDSFQTENKFVSMARFKWKYNARYWERHETRYEIEYRKKCHENMTSIWTESECIGYLVCFFFCKIVQAAVEIIK